MRIFSPAAPVIDRLARATPHHDHAEEEYRPEAMMLRQQPPKTPRRTASA